MKVSYSCYYVRVVWEKKLSSVYLSVKTTELKYFHLSLLITLYRLVLSSVIKLDHTMYLNLEHPINNGLGTEIGCYLVACARPCPATRRQLTEYFQTRVKINIYM